MDDESLLDIIFWLSLVLSLVLFLLSTMAVGKHFADLQYQHAAKLNGIRWVQSWINLRTHGNRVLFAIAFSITSILGLFDVNQLTRTWIGRILLLIVLIFYMASSILDWIAEHKQLITLLKYEEVNNLGTVRNTIHRLNNKLMEYFNFSLLHTEQINTPNVAEELQKEKEDMEHTIIEMVKTIQRDIRSMDPSYKGTDVTQHGAIPDDNSKKQD